MDFAGFAADIEFLQFAAKSIVALTLHFVALIITPLNTGRLKEFNFARTSTFLCGAGNDLLHGH